MSSATLGRTARSDVRGCQTPRISHVPPHVNSAGVEAVQVYELTGNTLDPWQRSVLSGALGERPDGLWSAFEVGLVVARQNGKDEILAARELWGLFVGGEKLIVHSAHKFDTAMDHMDRLVGLIDSVPEFRKRLAPRQPNRSHGSEGIKLKGGPRIRFRARTKSGGGRGLTGDCVIFNEAMELPDEIVGSIMPIMSARSMRAPGPQIWFTGSAVDQQTMQNGTALTRIREAGRLGENQRLAYFEWSSGVREWLEQHDIPFDVTRPEVDQATLAFLEDTEMWAQANPALGYRISAEHVQTEFESPALSGRQFAIERLGVADWPDVSEDAGRIISKAEWEAAAETDLSKRITGPPIFAADANPSMTWASIAVSGRRKDGMFSGAVVDRRRGTDWIVSRLQELKAENPRMRVVIHTQGPLGSHLDDLKRAKIKVIEANTLDYSHACIGFVAGVTEKRFRYPAPQRDLDEALGAARRKDTAETVRWTRADATSPDISPLVAVTLAYWAAERAKKASVVDMGELWEKIADADALVNS